MFPPRAIDHSSRAATGWSELALIVPDNTEQRLTIPKARTDFAIIEDELEPIHARLACLPMRVTCRLAR